MKNKLIKITLFLTLSIVLVNCKSDAEKAQEVKDAYEAKFVLNKQYKVGDVRRYGVMPNAPIIDHPFSKKSALLTALELSDSLGIELDFPKGNYDSNLFLDSKKNIKAHFNASVFHDIHITNEGKTGISKNITFTGKLISDEGFGIYDSDNIKIDTLIIRNKHTADGETKTKGCHIYKNTNLLTIKYLEIESLASTADNSNQHAALALDGAAMNPKDVSINEVYIKSSDRHGVYLTGNGHAIGKITIDVFGVGSAAGMSGMQDAEPGQEKEFTGVWLNLCKSSTIGEVIINCKDSKGKYAFKFEKGDMTEATTIQKLKILNFKESLPIEYTPNTVVINETIKE